MLGLPLWALGTRRTGLGRPVGVSQGVSILCPLEEAQETEFPPALQPPTEWEWPVAKHITGLTMSLWPAPGTCVSKGPC